MKQLVMAGAAVDGMTLIECTMNLIRRIRRAMHTKSTHFEVDERLDLAIHEGWEAAERSARITSTLNRTLERVKETQVRRV